MTQIANLNRVSICLLTMKYNGQIYKVAFMLFFLLTSISEINKIGNVSVRTVYKYMKNKIRYVI